MSWAADPLADARQAWQLLDYIAVDYPGAVRDGEVVEPGEYAEMQEFAASVRDKLQGLPAQPQQAGLLTAADELKARIARRDSPERVGKAAHALADQLLTAYGIEAQPKAPPRVGAAAHLYAQQCAACHGASGHGDGPAAASLSPPPIAFADAQRAAQRSPLALYQVITQGLPGTAMASFSQLSEADRWALAFYVGGFAYGPEARARGEALWRDDPAVHTVVPSLEALSRASEQDLAKSLQADQAQAITAYLRAHPESVEARKREAAATFSIARQQLDAALQAYRAGDQAQAKALALSAYLDGVEPVEPMLAARNRPLMREIETAMGQFRAQIAEAVPAAEVTAQAGRIVTLFDRAATTLQESRTDATTAFLGSFTILLREGLEALLIVIGMIAFLRKAERRDVLPYVHAGWIGALLAGVVTWAVATYLVGVSGANREVTEGLSALFAAAVLLSVGIWMHQKSLAGRWQHYLHAKMSAALTRRSAIFLFSLAFIAVYREVFETILFFIAMWSDHNGGAIIGGLVAGTVVLGAVAFWMLRISRRLPISQFFSISSLLIAILAVVLVGKGIAALQEAGWVAQALVPAPRIDWLGVYPSLQSLAAQAAVAIAAAIGFWVNIRSTRRVADASGGRAG
ncbi:High-affinity iron permease [Lysobacter dokdonensis DS-58]|uniref:High-affinity iron permease n=1 Tax=Lysobacter dokdonensis DS-58 TaxID=1300345 RepID=A0A0A2WCS1_9GAMM|nr:FTR1 family protein [Lysobacter dokdonensis]KGQ17891.1 High-affinity iron permease [Lysobacter dokdonensis DS-58]